jgi:hypothetical protein
LGRATKLWAGNGIPPRTGCDGPYRHGDRSPAKKSVSPSCGLLFAYPWPSRDRRHDRMRSTGTGACQNRVCYCSSLHGGSPTNARANVAGRDGDSTRVLAGPRRNRNCEAQGEMRPFALFHQTARGADAPGARGLVFPGRRLHEAAPTGSESPEPLCLGCVVPPGAILRCPGQKK